MRRQKPEKDYVRILGARGSMPVSGRDYLRYGGSTACILVRMAGETILLDAGTGILRLPKEVMELPRLSLLLSHCHADHLIGLPMCPYLMKPGGRLDIYAAGRGGDCTAECGCGAGQGVPDRQDISEYPDALHCPDAPKRRGSWDCRQQLARLFSPPLWPVTPEQMPAEITCRTISGSFRIGKVTIDTADGCHPGGVTLFRLTGNGKRLLYMTDTTINDQTLPELAAFAEDCDLLLCDGQFSREEFAQRPDFGHSCWNAAAELGRLCGAKRVRIIHHDPGHSDRILEAAEKELANSQPNCGFAKEGEIIEL